MLFTFSLRVVLTALLIAFVLTATPAHASAPAASAVADARAALADGAYGEALAHARAALEHPDDRAEATYILALVAWQQNAPQRVITELQPFAERHPASKFRHKAAFLLARALAHERRFEEAEAIYARETTRLLSAERTREIASVLIDFAEELAADPDPNELNAAPPQYDRAASLYAHVLQMELERSLRADVEWALAGVHLKANHHHAAVNTLESWLSSFDPTWRGRDGSRPLSLDPVDPAPREMIRAARLAFADALRRSGDGTGAVRHAEDLLALLADATDSEAPRMVERARRLRIRAGLDHRVIPPPRLIELIEAYLAAYPASDDAPELAFGLGAAYGELGLNDRAATAWQAFIDGTSYTRAPQHADDAIASMRERAYMALAQLRYAERRFDAALEWLDALTRAYPDGAQWADAQRFMIDVRFQSAVAALADDDRALAAERFEDFLRRHPLDAKAARALFALGRLDEVAARDLIGRDLAQLGREPDPDESDAATAARRHVFAAIATWERLASKYDQSAEASHGLFRVARLLETMIGDLDAAVAAYRRVTFGPAAPLARAQLQTLTEAALDLRTERTFRTAETAAVRVDVRNVESLTVRQYALDAEAYFRKMHTLRGIEALDIGLIEPDREWTVEVEAYERYRPESFEIPIALDGADVCLVHVASPTMEATTIVIRSDLEFIVRAGRDEALVYVQDMAAMTPARGATVLLSDGRRIVAHGTTDALGVAHVPTFEDAAVESLRIYVARDGHVAANQLRLGATAVPTPLHPVVYVHTDRPAYQRGEVVHFRGIIRDVSDGSYAVPLGETVIAQVIDSAGRRLQRFELEASRFGTVHGEFTVDEHAVFGDWYLTLEIPELNVKKLHAFRVESIELQKIAVDVTLDQTMARRGEMITGTVSARYDWGAPVTNEVIRIQLPTGQTIERTTDASGRASFTVETAPLTVGGTYHVSATLVTENVSHAASFRLPARATTVALETDRAVVLHGEALTVDVTALDATGAPAERELTIEWRRFVETPPSPFLDVLQWGTRQPDASTSVVEATTTVTTDPKTGRARTTQILDASGRWQVRAVVDDALAGTIQFTHDGITCSGSDDDTRLRLFTDDTTVDVGTTANVRVHSRIPRGLGLVTIETDRLQRWLLIDLRDGETTLPLPIDSAHYPSFTCTVSALHDRALHEASLPFTVTRALTVSIESVSDHVEPGAPTTVGVRVVDQTGTPVEAELSVTLVPEALLRQYWDTTPPLAVWFQNVSRRRASFESVSSNSFVYQGTVSRIVQALLDEAQRERQQMADAERLSYAAEVLLDRSRAGGRMAPSVGLSGGNISSFDTDDMVALTSESARKKSFDGLGRLHRANVQRGDAASATPRREFPGAGWAEMAIVTDAEGRATLTLPAPSETREWRLAARGITVDSLGGEAEATLVTRREFFVELPIPNHVVEGDRVRLIARIHDAQQREGVSRLTFKVRSGDEVLSTTTRELSLDGSGVTELVLDPVTVPMTGAITFLVEAEHGERRDALERTIPVRPWGLVHEDIRAGVASGSIATSVALPAGRPYRTRALAITLGRQLESFLIDLALDRAPSRHGVLARHIAPPHPIPAPLGAQLTASAAALRYAETHRAPAADVRDLRRRTQSLIAALVGAQHDGGWGLPGRTDLDWLSTVINYRALCAATESGVHVESSVIDAARAILLNQFRNASSTDAEQRALLLYALAADGSATYELANPLYRERQSLSPIALAATAVVFAELDRATIARELLALLPPLDDDVRLLPCPGGSDLFGPVFTTALAAQAYERVDRGHAALPAMIDAILARRTDGVARGVIVEALTAWFSSGGAVDPDLAIEVIVNRRTIGTIRQQNDERTVVLPVPAAALVDGRNDVRFEVAGRGQYAWSVELTGFSESFQDPGTLRYPRVSDRKYLHAPLLYRGRALGVSSTSPVAHLPLGARTVVRVNLSGHASNGWVVIDEPFPAGMRLVPGSMSLPAGQWERTDAGVRITVPPHHSAPDFQYELAAVTPGTWRIAPTSIRERQNPARMRLGAATELTVLGPDDAPVDPYRMNDAERLALGRALFDDGKLSDAAALLQPLFDRPKKYAGRDVARMLLWIHTTDGFYDAARIVETFEFLSIKYPDLRIPFERILTVGSAYHELEEFERAWLVYRATIDSTFLVDSGLAAFLDDQGQLLASLDYQRSLWWEYPDTSAVESAAFALGHMLVQASTQPARFVRQRQGWRGTDADEMVTPSRVPLLLEGVRCFRDFMTWAPGSPLLDDAAFSLVAAELDLEAYEAVVRDGTRYAARFADSPYRDSLQYMVALGQFWQHAYDDALASARPVAEGESRDRDFARYIIGQVYHARGNAPSAIEWYDKVATRYPDAAEAIEYFRRQSLTMDEVTTFRPGEAVTIEFEHRNVTDAHLQVYKVDLMTLYLRERNLSTITGVNLAGITPSLDEHLTLAGQDFRRHTTRVPIDLTDDGAYLVICRGDDLFASGLILVSPLELEVQEDAQSGRVRANLIDVVDGRRPAKVHVKAIGTANAQFISGETDLRGVFIADGLRGAVTVIARGAGAQYAFHRGTTTIGAVPGPGGGGGGQGQWREKAPIDYLDNVRNLNNDVQLQGNQLYDVMRRSGKGGVQIDQAR